MLDFSVGSRMVLDSIGARRGSCSPGSTLPAPTLPGSTSPAHPGSSSPGFTLPAPTLPGSTSPGSSLPTDGDETACARLDWWTDDRHGLGIVNDGSTCYMNAVFAVPQRHEPCTAPDRRQCAYRSRPVADDDSHRAALPPVGVEPTAARIDIGIKCATCFGGALRFGSIPFVQAA